MERPNAVISRQRNNGSGDLSVSQLAWILLVFFVMSTLSNVIFPPFEGPDEHSHYQYCKVIAQGKGLPVQTDPNRTADAEGFNPPLYYLVPASILSIVDPECGKSVTQIGVLDLEELIHLASRGLTYPPMNPVAFQSTDPRVFLHPREGIFSSRALIAIHAMRMFSSLCGVAMLFAVYLVAKTALPGRKDVQLLALAIVAFNPQFVYISSQINRDNLICIFSTLVIWRQIKVLQGETKPIREAFLFGLLLGLGALSKPTTLYLFVPTVAVLFVESLRRMNDSAPVNPSDSQRKMKSANGSEFARFVVQLLIIGIVSFAIAGWFYIRNAMLYGNLDFFGWKKQIELHNIFSLAPEERLTYFRTIFFPLLFTSFWGRFGWLVVKMPAWAYAFYGLFTASLLGALPLQSKNPNRWATKRSILILCWCVFLLNLVALIWFNFRFKSNQGRQLFPSLGAIAVLLACGFESLTHLLKTTFQIKILRITVGILFLAEWFVQLFVIYPLYCNFAMDYLP